MSMIIVDPELFVTCRLCLEDKGSYQIVPTVIQQMKFCFDINVDPFDGLPQLLCTKCEKILSEYLKIKKTFLDKQNYLISRLRGKNESTLISEEEVVSSSRQTNNEKNIKNIKPKKRKAIISSTSSDTDSNEALVLTDFNKRDSPINTGKLLASWKNGYKKRFLCRMCKASRTKISAILRHVRIHDHLKAKYGNAFKKYCTVNLNKTDDAPNITGSTNAVVYSREIIFEGGNLDYFAVYSKQTTSISDSVSVSDENEILHSESESKNSTKDCESSDSSDQDVNIKRKRKRRKRLISRSSNETVVIGTNGRYDSSDSEEESNIKSLVESRGTELTKSDCIDIEDSSDSTSNENHINLRSKKKKEPIKADYKTINNIVTMCRKNYLKKYDCDDSNKNKHTTSTESQLKHKILSIGMKIINKQGFNCTGLLRFMEHKNLDIVWLANVTKELNHMRIMTKLRRVGECTKNDTGWKSLSTLKINEINKLKTHPETENMTSFNSSTINRKGNENDIPIEPDSGVLYNISNSEIKKLLNANPVANPKQLPKKSVVNETKNIMKKINTNQNVSNVDKDVSVSIKNPDINLCMPIIASTTSLAVDITKDKKDDENGDNDGKGDTPKPPANQSVSDTFTPRIKVKPASELMSERVLNYSNLLKEPTPVLNTKHGQQLISLENTVNVYIPNVTVAPLQNTGQSTDTVGIPKSSNVSTVSMSSESTINSGDYVILHTPELPNTKTDSPFKYFKKLLQIHNITLLDTDQMVQNFICLIKFKVLFKQETKDQPVILCLSLFCLANNFCLNIKSRNQENIKVDNISANWQWEILKIYNGDVVNKILQNARRVSQEVYENTNHFLCLLKSIDYKKNT